jgi:hypothetical protein
VAPIGKRLIETPVAGEPARKNPTSVDVLAELANVAGEGTSVALVEAELRPMRSLVCFAVLSVAACHHSPPTGSSVPVDDNVQTTSAEAPAPTQAPAPATVVVTPPTAPAPQVSIYVNGQPPDQGAGSNATPPSSTQPVYVVPS